MILTRKYYNDRTEGEIILPNGKTLYTIERARTGDYPCIPEGRSIFERDLIGKHRWWRILEVSGRTHIEIHPANYVHQLRGCIAPCTHIVDGVGRSSVKACNILLDFYGDVGVRYVLDITS